MNGQWLEVPDMRLTPRDLAVLIDRLVVVIDHASIISEARGPTPLVFSDGSRSTTTAVLVGKGAYQGLTAVAEFALDGEARNLRGIIIAPGQRGA